MDSTMKPVNLRRGAPSAPAASGGGFGDHCDLRTRIENFTVEETRGDGSEFAFVHRQVSTLIS